jgi:iron complex transport system substrate-binding protein
MAEDTDDGESRTRRTYLKHGGAVVLGGLLAGCTGGGDGGDGSGSPTGTATPTETTTETETETETGTETATETATETPTATETTTDTSYSVTMVPVGELTFEKPPEKAVAYWSTYGDMLVALGQGDALLATAWGPGSYPKYPYEEIPDLDFSPEQTGSLYADGGLSKELLYEMDPEVVHFDPNIMRQWFGFDDSDVTEVTENLGPFAANYIRRKGDKWHDYPYYSLYEAFEKIAKIYQQEERYEAFKGVHDEMIGSIRSRLPPEAERPAVALISDASDTAKGDLTGYPIEDQVGKKQYNDLGVKNGLAELETDEAFYEIDYEGLLEADPEIIVAPWGMVVPEEKFEENFVQPMKDDPVGSQVAAVENDRVFRGGAPNQGPIINLVNTEIAAQQLYPDVFGDERLFDRQRVADIVNGNL